MITALPSTGQASEEQSLELEDTTPWPNNPSDELLYAVTVQLSKEEQDSHIVMNEDSETLIDKDTPLGL